MSDLMEEHDDMPEIINGLRYIVPAYDGFILDIYGVIFDGLELYPETVPCLTKLKNLGKRVCLLSNAPERGHEMAQKLADKGLDPELYTAVVTAGDSAHEAMRDYRGMNCWFASTERFGSLIEGAGVNIVDSCEDADFILNAISGQCPVSEKEVYHQMEIALRRGLKMICANPDLVVNIGPEQHICAGTYAIYYEQAGGKVSYHGKPHQAVYDKAWRALGRPDKLKTLAIGDSLNTDVQGANLFGIPCLFNLVGIHWEEVKLDHRAGEADIAKVRVMIDSQPHRPHAILCGFKW